MTLTAPFPYFGGKSKVASVVWSALGQPKHYMEPFFGSGAVLLARPDYDPSSHVETVCDKDGFLANAWRSIQFSPEETARWCDWPVNHCVPAGTLISTPRGLVPVEQITTGMTVWGVEEFRVVPAIVGLTSIRTTSKPLVKIGRLALTQNHPVWTNRGYEIASNITHGMKLGVLNDWRVDNPNLKVIRWGHATENVDHLRFSRPPHWRDSLCGCDRLLPQKTIWRTHIEGQKWRKNTPGLLDKIFAKPKLVPNYFRLGARSGWGMARARMLLDLVTPGNKRFGQSNRWGRGHSWIQNVKGGNREIGFQEEGKKIPTWTRKRHVRQAPYAGGYRKNQDSRIWPSTYRRKQRKTIPRKNGEVAVSGTQGKTQRGAFREKVECGTQAAHCGFHREPKTFNLPGNETGFCINNSGSTVLWSNRDNGLSVSVQRSSLQRFSPSINLTTTVYNFQTTTGNYFANGILVHNCDLMARKAEIIRNEGRLLENLVADPEWHDPKVGGYWIWAACCWIGSGLTRPGQVPHLAGTGKGVHKLGQVPHLAHAGKGVHKLSGGIYDWFDELSLRLRRVRVVCGDWKRICGGNWQDKFGVCGMFFDPPYSSNDRDSVYTHEDFEVGKEVRAWAIERGRSDRYRIVYAGYVEEGEELEANGWSVFRWKAGGGYGNTNRNGGESRGKENRKREALWMSPHCECRSRQGSLFEGV